MPIAKLLSAGMSGIDATTVHVEIDINKGLPGWSTVGLPESAVREAKERVISSIHNSGYQFPFRRITLNLAPADVKKSGTAYDLPIAVGLLVAAEMIPPEPIAGYGMLGELSLDGQLRPVRGALSAAVLAKQQGWKGLILPKENLPEAGLIEGVHIRGAVDLPEVVEFLHGRRDLPSPQDLPKAKPRTPSHQSDFTSVRGQAHVKRALEIAAAGFHNILMVDSHTRWDLEKNEGAFSRPIFKHPSSIFELLITSISRNS